ncbi:unnamed protein product [Thelazia callipaeda]|uniref:Bromo domain-containing protein n=1 Tax=Thelazia callipaeda TaxID=103827 RepID=A0A0N5CV50_THECL|nr:unnamed protein product [Thelazia callipaeda]
MSLDENFLLGNSSGDSLLRSLVNQANRSRHSCVEEKTVQNRSSYQQIKNSYMLPRPFRYSTRSKNRIYVETFGVATGTNTDDEECDSCLIHPKFRKKLSSKQPSPVSGMNSSGSDSAAENTRSSNSKTNNSKNVGKKEIVQPDMYENVKQRSQIKRQAVIAAETRKRSIDSYSAVRKKQSKKDGSDEYDDQTNGAAEEENDPENVSRHYALRTHINPVIRFSIDQRPQSTRSDFQRHLSNKLKKHRLQREIIRKRMCDSESDSSSVSTSFELADQDNHSGYRSLQKRNKTKPYLRSLNSEDLLYMVREKIRKKSESSNIKGSDTDSLHIDRSIDFSKIGGLNHHIQSLKEVVLLPLLYGEVFSQFGIQPPKGVIFYGPPGTGKTLVARALANLCAGGTKKISFFMRKGADILSKWVGESERQLRSLFEQAFVMRPSIIFFDEIDGLAPVRSSKQDQVHSSVVSTLLALMDGLDSQCEVVVIGATNRLDAIDPALRRPGRFDRELCFRLPTKNSRQEILKIHTSSWGVNKPNDDLLSWLSDRTSGYCGADLKSLCTEAVLISFRSQFPQVYVSEEKVVVDSNALKVGKNEFEIAMRRIVPAARRDITIPSRVLDDRLRILLEDLILSICHRVPKGYRGVIEANDNVGQIEQVLSTLHANPVVPPARLLIYGSSSDMGQTSYILPALINIMDHLSVFSLSMNNIFSYGSPEECFSQCLQSAIRASSRGTPCLLLIPSIDKWYTSVSQTVWNLLLTAVSSYTYFTSIFLLATAECTYLNLPSEVQLIFHWRDSLEIMPPPVHRLEAYFRHVIIEQSCTRPINFNLDHYPVLPIAEPMQSSLRLNADEIMELKNLYDDYTLTVVLHYEETIVSLMRDSRFKVFTKPVDPVDVPDYYTYIKNPMDLQTMFSKVSAYKTQEEVIDDLRLIYQNAIEYNPITDYRGRQIRIMAKLLLDKGTRLILDLDSEYVKRLENVKKLLRENGVKLDDLCNLDGVKQAVISDSCDLEGEVISDSSEKKLTGNRDSRTTEAHPVLQINLTKLEELVRMAVMKTRNWPLVHLEQLATALTESINSFLGKWDRRELPKAIEKLILSWGVSG